MPGPAVAREHHLPGKRPFYNKDPASGDAGSLALIALHILGGGKQNFQRLVQTQLAGAKGQVIVAAVAVDLAGVLLAVVAAGTVGTVLIGLQLLKGGVRHQLAHTQQTPVAVGVHKNAQGGMTL